MATLCVRSSANTYRKKRGKKKQNYCNVDVCPCLHGEPTEVHALLLRAAVCVRRRHFLDGRGSSEENEWRARSGGGDDPFNQVDDDFQSLLCYIGNLKMEIFRYEKDARSIPVTGEQNGVIGIGPNTSFSVRDGMLYLADPDAQDGTVPVGTHMQYTVNAN